MSEYKRVTVRASTEYEGFNMKLNLRKRFLDAMTYEQELGNPRANNKTEFFHYAIETFLIAWERAKINGKKEEK